MPNFKRYLKESELMSVFMNVELNYSIYDMTFHLESSHRQSEINMFLDDFSGIIKEEYPYARIDFNRDDYLYIEVPINQNHPATFFDTIRFDVLKAAHENIEDKTCSMRDHCVTFRQEIPDWCKLEYDHFEFRLRFSKMTDFKDVHKHIQSTEDVTILNGEKIQSHVLGFMMMPKLQSIYTEQNNPAEWIKVVQYHLQTDRDLLDCQEDLISKGLKEYAKI